MALAVTIRTITARATRASRSSCSRTSRSAISARTARPYKDEPGYYAVNNPDPSGDNYDPQYNPPRDRGQSALGRGRALRRTSGLDGGVVPDHGHLHVRRRRGQRQVRHVEGARDLLRRATAACRRSYKFAQRRPFGPWDDKAHDNLDYIQRTAASRDIFNWARSATTTWARFVAKNRPSVNFNDWEFLPNADLLEVRSPGEERLLRS